jgi:uncharacterized membrane protein YedE/YeeE
MVIVAAAVCGLIFGWGLLVSGMVQPAKVLGFLDIFGSWDPSLAVVMVAALAVSSVGFRFAASRKHPILAAQCIWPTKTGIDRPLVVGAAMFGIGWGLVGLCPGPALENLATLSPRVVAFVVAMAFGIVLQRIWARQRTGRQQHEAASVVAVDG